MPDEIANVSLVKALACKSNELSALRLEIPVMNQSGEHVATLACIDRALANDMEIIADLTAWRQRYMQYFLTQFEATVSRTKDWIDNIVIPSHDRLFFIIYLTTGEAIGNFGICKMTVSSGELDNIIRGKKVGVHRLIYFCELALLSWMFGHLGYLASNLHVLSSNEPSIKLHLSVGFSVLDTIKLTCRKLNDKTEYLLNSREGVVVNFSCLEMVLTRNTFLELHPWVPTVYNSYWQSNS